MSNSWKYHTSATDGEDTLPHYVRRCLASFITSSPKQTCRVFDLCHNTHLMVQCLVLQILCLLFTSSPSVSLFLLPQTRHCLAKHAECYWAHRHALRLVRAGALYDSSRQLVSITPTRESFVRDGFKVGFSTLYFTSTCVQTLPKHLFQLSKRRSKGLCRKQLKFKILQGLKRPKDWQTPIQY